MAGLEDRLLKKNIPGKYSWWDEYNQTEREDLDEDDAYEPEDELHPQAPPPPNPRDDDLPSSGIAGPKGVLADYKLHQEEYKRRAMVERLEKMELVERNTLGSLLKPGEVSMSLASQRVQVQRQPAVDDDSDNDEDEEFIARYRERRIQELRQASAVPEFEGVEDVSPEAYSKAVDNTDHRVFLVVHLYESYIPACRTLTQFFEKLARHESMKHVRFLALKATSAMDTIDSVALPSVLIHRNGQLVKNLTPITNDLPNKFGPNDVLELLEECMGKPPSAALPAKPTVVTCTDPDSELDEYCEGFDGTI